MANPEPLTPNLRRLALGSACACVFAHTVWQRYGWYLYVLGSAQTLFAEVFGLDQSSRLHRLAKRAMAEQQAAEVIDELRRELQLAQHRMLELRKLSNSDEQRNKRGPPSTGASSMATPQDDGPQMITGAASSAQPEGTIPNLFQSLPVATEALFSLTAAYAGVDINDGSALQAWMQASVTTRQDVLQTLRNYDVAVIRREVYHMIAHVENIIGKLDDRMIRLQDDRNWLASENSAAQKRKSGLIFVLTGFDPKMEPAARYEQINWKQTRVHRQQEKESGAPSPQSSSKPGISGSPSWQCMVEAMVHRFGKMAKHSKASTSGAPHHRHSSKESWSCQFEPPST